MKYIEVSQFGDFDQLKLREGDDPQPKDGEIVIDVRAAGVNYADVMAISGQYPGVPQAPYRPGFEVAGEVCAVGQGVKNWKVGDRAMALIGSGGLAEKAVAPAQTAAPIPPQLSFADSMAFLIQGLTAFFLLDSAPLNQGETVMLSSAAGGVGTMAIPIARLKGASKIIGLASPRSHERVRALGAEPVDYREEGWSARVKELAPGGVDVFLDSTGALDGEGFETLNLGARWVIFGDQSPSDAPLPKARATKMLFQSIALRGFGLNPQQYDIGRGLRQLGEWVESGQLQPHAEHFYPLSQARQAFEDIANRKTQGKVVLEP